MVPCAAARALRVPGRAWRQCTAESLQQPWALDRCTLARRAAAPARAAGTEAAAAQPVAQQQQAAAAAAAADGERLPGRFEDIMLHGRITTIAQELWSDVLREGDVAVDATAGNGHDTAFVAAAVGPSGAVHAFDIQAAALEATRQRVAAQVPASQAPALHCHLQSHAELLQHVAPGSARLVVFNLGYLPGSDKATTTQAGSTLAAVEAACEALRMGGLVSVLCYTAHPGGLEEYEAVKALAEGLPPRYWISSEVRLLNRGAPVLVLIWKRAVPAAR